MVDVIFILHAFRPIWRRDALNDRQTSAGELLALARDPRHPSGHGQKGTLPRSLSASAVSLIMPQDGEETEMLEDASLFRLADIVPSVMHHQQ